MDQIANHYMASQGVRMCEMGADAACAHGLSCVTGWDIDHCSTFINTYMVKLEAAMAEDIIHAINMSEDDAPVTMRVPYMPAGMTLNERAIRVG